MRWLTLRERRENTFVTITIHQKIHRLLEQLKVAVVLPAVAECSTNVRDGEGSHLREGEEVQEDGEGGERY